jgi:transcriptional regulator with XRE-family HTH domain
VIESLISSLVGALLPGVLWKSRMKSLVAAVMGLILSGRASLWEMASRAPGKAKAVNRGKRIWRLFQNREIDVEEIAGALLLTVTRNVQDVVVAIDWTEFGRWKILKAAVVTRSRGIPIYWKTVKDGNRRMAEVEMELCDALIRRLPPGKRLLILGDRGFHSAELVRFLKQRGVKFVLRFPHGVCLRQRAGEFIPVEDLPLKVGDLLDYGRVEYTKSSAVPARVIRTWMDGQAEEWNLVTNLGKNAVPRLIVNLYGRRFTIEELFRDYKGGDWGFDKSAIQTEAAMERLVLVMAIAHIVLVTIGTWARKSGLDRDFRSSDGLSLFTLGERVLQESATGNLPQLSSTDVAAQFNALPITLDEILELPWNKKRTPVAQHQATTPAGKPIPFSGARLRAYLSYQNLTQYQLADLIGCTQSIVSKVAAEYCQLPAAWIPKLLAHANLTLDEFLELDAPPPRPKRESKPKPIRIPTAIPEPPEVLHLRRAALCALWHRHKQKDLAMALDIAQSDVSRAIAGKRSVPEHWVRKLCDRYEMIEEQFLSLGQEQMQKAA